MSNVYEELPTASPCEEVFPPWSRAQREVQRLAREAPPPMQVLRTTGLLRPALAEQIAEWFTGDATESAAAVRASYRALEHETALLAEVIHRARRDGGLGVHVHYVRTEEDPYASAAALCAELRRDRSMQLRTIACDDPHPLLGGEHSGVSGH